MNRLSILYKIRYFPLNSTTLILLVVMKRNDFQKLVLSKYQNGDGSIQNFLDLNGSVSLRTRHVRSQSRSRSPGPGPKNGT